MGNAKHIGRVCRSAQVPPRAAMSSKSKVLCCDTSEHSRSSIAFCDQPHSVICLRNAISALLTSVILTRALLALIAFGALLAAAMLYATSAHADGDDDFLSGSTDALVLGPTSIPTPGEGYLSDVDKLYLDPNGFDGTTTAFTTPETSDFGPSVSQGETDLVNEVSSMYNAGDFGVDDPLTIFSYSQSAVVTSLAEQQLADDGIPTDALRLVMVGDTASAAGGFLNTWGETALGKDILDDLGWQNLVGATTPNDLYPTEVYTVNGDFWADYPNAASDGMTLHDTYLGLTEAEIQSATTTVDGLTDYNLIPDPSNILEALLNAANAL
jgi:PE-PPE domain